MKERRIKAELRNELRRLGSLKGLDYVYSKGKMGVADLRLLMFKIFHGDIAEGIASNAQMITEGTGDFAALYNAEMIAVTDPDPSSTNLDTTGLSLTLKTELSRSDVPVVAGKQITVQVLAKTNFNNGVQVTGRTLKRGADEALKTIKKAVAFVLPLLNDDGSPIQSGMTVELMTLMPKSLISCFVCSKAKNLLTMQKKMRRKMTWKLNPRSRVKERHLPVVPRTGSFTDGLRLNCSAQWLLKKSAFCSLQLGTHT
jgi:hypothetical protein